MAKKNMVEREKKRELQRWKSFLITLHHVDTEIDVG